MSKRESETQSVGAARAAAGEDRRREFEAFVSKTPERYAWWKDGEPKLGRDAEGNYFDSKARLAWACWSAP